MHSLRHACASLWIENGHNPKQIQRLMGHSSIKATFDVYGHLFQTLTRINAPPKHCRPDCSGANLMLERFKSLFRQNKVIASSSPLHLNARSERELSAALKSLPVGARGWISKSEAAKLYSSSDDAFDEWNSAGKLALSEFTAFAEHRCNFHVESDRVIFTRK